MTSPAYWPGVLARRTVSVLLIPASWHAFGSDRLEFQLFRKEATRKTGNRVISMRGDDGSILG